MKTFNIEQREAYQEKVNKDRKELASKLPKEEQDKIAAIEAATDILVKASVPAYVLGLVNLLSEKYPTLLQYNSLGPMLKADSEGNPDKESLIRTHLCNKFLVIHTIQIMMGMNCVGKNAKKSVEQTLNEMYNIYQHYAHGTDPILDKLEEIVDNTPPS